MNDALASLDAEFHALYTDFGRPSIAPERLIRASLIQILFSIRSERQLMEQMQYNLLFRRFVGLGIDDPVLGATVFTKNRDRLQGDDGDPGASRSRAAFFGRSFLGRWDAGEGLGLHEELPIEGERCAAG